MHTVIEAALLPFLHSPELQTVNFFAIQRTRAVSVFAHSVLLHEFVYTPALHMIWPSLRRLEVSDCA